MFAWMSNKEGNPNLDWGVILPHCWVFLNNSKTVKAVTLAFDSI